MKILMLHPHDLLTDPWTVRPLSLAKEFTKQKHSVTLVYFENSEARIKKSFLEEDQDNLTNLVCLKRIGYKNWAHCDLVTKLATHHDLIHLQKAIPHAAYPALYAARKANKPLHYDWDDLELEIYKQGVKPKFWEIQQLKLYEHILLKLSNSISVSSHYLQKRALASGVPEEYLTLAWVGADSEDFASLDISEIKEDPRYGGSTAGNSLLIGYVGQLGEGCYLEKALPAIKKILDAFPQAKFVVIGAGRYLEKFQNLAQQWQLENKMIFTGLLSRLKTRKFIAAFDIALMLLEDNPQAQAKSPLKLAEYLAAGKAIIASEVGEVPYMLGFKNSYDKNSNIACSATAFEKTALLIPPDNLESLENALAELICKPELRDVLGKAALKIAQEKLSWKISAQKILNLYQKVLNQR